jgi:hypothetical protein
VQAEAAGGGSGDVARRWRAGRAGGGHVLMAWVWLCCPRHSTGWRRRAVPPSATVAWGENVVALVKGVTKVAELS